MPIYSERGRRWKINDQKDQQITHGILPVRGFQRGATHTKQTHQRHRTLWVHDTYITTTSTAFLSINSSIWLYNKIIFIIQLQLLWLNTLLVTLSLLYWRFNIVIVPPMLMIPNQLEGARIGDYSKLECHSEANPPSINYWTNERGDMIVSGTYITILNYYYMWYVHVFYHYY